MRKLIGCLVLIVGVGSLGYVATAGHAVGIQSMIAADAEAVAGAARYDIQARVSGRDVTVSGVVTNPTELAELEAEFGNINGVRLVQLSDVDILPVADPFVLTATQPVDGSVTLAGSVPSEDARAALSEIAGDAVEDLVLAAGAPDEDWVSVVAKAISALNLLTSGEMTLSDRDIEMTGLARNPDVAAEVIAALEGLPDRYSVTTEIDIEDDGTPLRLTLTLLDGSVSGRVKFPADVNMAQVFGRFSTSDVEIIQSALPADDTEWSDAVRAAVDALALLIDGQLEVEEQDISLKGHGTPDGIAKAADLLTGLPDEFVVTSDLSLWDDGAPFAMTLLWDGTTASAEGKFPADFTPSGPEGVDVQSTAEQSFLIDETGDFAANAAAGTTALELMATGTVQVTARVITLIGTAASPQIDEAIDSALENAAEGTTVTRDLTYLDDGSPSAWTLTYVATTGAQIEGRMPVGLDVDDIAQSLGLADINGSPGVALEDDDAGNTLDTLKIAAAYLPEIETMTYTREGGMSELNLVLSPGVDVDLVANDLAERLPPDLAFALSPLEDVPATGTTRTNAATGYTEEFSDGFWLPDVDFATDVEGCTEQTAAVLERSRIEFLSGSARLEATSIRAINGLAAVVLPCVAADLSLEVGGHTDATGSELDNVELSQARAEAVQQALLARRVPAEAITAYGFGQSEPIADNETPEGRAANRRTDITWYAPGDLREP